MALTPNQASCRLWHICFNKHILQITSHSHQLCSWTDIQNVQALLSEVIPLTNMKKQSNGQVLLTASSLKAGFKIPYIAVAVLHILRTWWTCTVLWNVQFSDGMQTANCKVHKIYPHITKCYSWVSNVTNFNECQTTHPTLLYLNLADMSCPNCSSIILQPVQLIYIMGF